MGVHENVSHDRWPSQGVWLGRAVRVAFHYDTTRAVPGTVVRDDDEDPWLTVIRLDDGRVVLGTECQFQVLD